MQNVLFLWGINNRHLHDSVKVSTSCTNRVNFLVWGHAPLLPGSCCKQFGILHPSWLCFGGQLCAGLITIHWWWSTRRPMRTGHGGSSSSAFWEIGNDGIGQVVPRIFPPHGGSGACRRVAAELTRTVLRGHEGNLRLLRGSTPRYVLVSLLQSISLQQTDLPINNTKVYRLLNR